MDAPRKVLNEADTKIGDAEMAEPFGVPRAFTCDYFPQLREMVARIDARQEGDSKTIMRIDTTLQGKLNGLIVDLQDEVKARLKQEGLDLAELTGLKARTKQTAATVSAVVAFLVAIGGQLAIKYLLG